MSKNKSAGNEYLESDKSWNMAKNFLDRLDKRCDERDTFATQGDLLSWYRSLRAVFRNIHFEVIKPGHEEAEIALDNLFKKALTALTNASNQRQDLARIGVNDTEVLLDKIDMKLNDLMYQYDLIMPKIKRRNMEAELVGGWFDD